MPVVQRKANEWNELILELIASPHSLQKKGYEVMVTRRGAVQLIVGIYILHG